MNSVWTETAAIHGFPPLRGDTKKDVLIIGGGMAGILCAYYLQQAGVDYLLVEGQRIGGGITKNTTAKITSQHGLLYHALSKSAGAEHAKMYLEANQRALGEYRSLCAGIDCDFEEKDAFVYSLRNKKAIEDEAAALQALDFPAEYRKEIPLPFDIAGAVKFSQQAQFHPMKFLAQISQGLNIREHTFVQALSPRTAITNRNKITADFIIVATHFPILNKHGAYWLKMYQHRSYAIALEGGPQIEGMYLEETDDGMSFRNYGDFLIVGGGDHKTGKQGGGWPLLRNFATRAYPGAQERYAWATQDCMTLDGLPYIGRYGKSAQGLFVATGFNKWGMTSSMVSAMILTDMILGRQNDFAEAFCPQRSILKPQLLANGLSAMGNLLTPSLKRCPHLGCALQWNTAERSWDCPCHGSRFGEDGSLIDNPATGDCPCLRR